MKLKHWLKNLVIFFPVFFAGEVFNKEKLFTVIIGFFGISFISSAGYVFNNLIDAKNDRLDLYKKNKNPIANGSIEKNMAVMLLITFFISGFLISFNINIYFCSIALLYFLNVVVYSLFLKNILFIDLTAIAFGFVLRLWLGGVAADIKISPWLFILVLIVSFVLGTGKRYEEISRNIKGKVVLKKYNKKYLEIFIIVFSFLSLAFFSVYLYMEKRLSVVLILLSIFLASNYLFTVLYKKRGEPTDFLTSDIIDIIILVLWFLLFYKIIYL